METCTGAGGDSLWGGTFEDEIVEKLKHDKPGVISMGNYGRKSPAHPPLRKHAHTDARLSHTANTNTSQFSMMIGPAPHLDGGYTIFAQVVEGMDVVRAINEVSTNDRERPENFESALIRSVVVLE